MKVMTFFFLLVLSCIFVGIYFWMKNPPKNKQQLAPQMIELEKIFKDTTGCDECGLTPLEH